jgi:2-polyprenyl-3-methyl-5-hydroxy-6-metoxy-1,4-benzoquinol methylase
MNEIQSNVASGRRLSAMCLAVCGRARMRLLQWKRLSSAISRKRVLDLQCHIGRNTLCLARRAAVVTELDFSPAAIECARRLSMESELTAIFIQRTR